MRLPDDDELPEGQIRIRDLSAGDNFVVRDADGNSVYAGYISDDGTQCIIPTEDLDLNDQNPMVGVFDEHVFVNQVRAQWTVEEVRVV